MIYHFGECTLDTQLYSVQRGGQTIRLRPKVFRMCLYLLEHRDRVVPREELCAQLWPGRFVNPATLEGVIRSVRQALGDNGRAQGIILTRHSYGYRFVAPVAECPPESMGVTGPLASTRHVQPEASDLGQADGEVVSVALAEEPAVAHDHMRQGGITRGGPEENGYDGRSHAATALGGRQARRQRSTVGWRVAHVGLALALMLLLSVGSWAFWQGVGEHAAVAPEKSRIAVLPFTDLSAEANQSSFADGMTQELIAQLAQIHGLTVIARTSVMKYKGTLKDVASIGRELRVGTILEGSVRAVDNQLRINAQLIDVASQGHLWSQEYDRELTGVYSSQSDIARRLAQDLRGRLTVAEKQRADLPAQGQHASF
jgi:TolB-like protein/DNA-binding winged helix-turn-helix (wHTH) protein